MSTDSLENKLQTVCEDVQTFAPSREVQILAVTKYGDVDQVLRAYRAGLVNFGENRIQDFENKIKKLLQFDKKLEKEDFDFSKTRWHFIGRIQKNKINKLLKIPGLKVIHSLDSLELIKELSKKMSLYPDGQKLECFIQCNPAKEAEKAGLQNYEQLVEVIDFFKNSCSNKLSLAGLMCMSPLRTDDYDQSAYKTFADLHQWRERLLNSSFLESKQLKLSMGMSDDYKQALKAGADVLRLGTVLFK